MKRTRQVSAGEAIAWMKKHEGEAIRCPEGYRYRCARGVIQQWRPSGISGYWQDAWLINRHQPYTITEEIDEPDRFEQQRDELEKWMREKELAALSFERGPLYEVIREREDEVRHVESENDRLLIRNQYLSAELEKLKAEKKKGYQWKNCAEQRSVSFAPHALRKVGSDLDTLGFFSSGHGWLVCSGWRNLPLPDPENWEFLEL